MEIKVKKLSPQATVPTKANDSDAGWDLYASEDAIIDPSKAELLSTHISVAIPEGYVGLIWDRSSMAAKRGLHRFAGVIDSGYRGEIKVCLGIHLISTVWLMLEKELLKYFSNRCPHLL